MIESTLATGDKGLLIVQDNTDGSDKTVDLYIQSTSTIAIAQLPWSYSIDDAVSVVKQFNFTDTVLRQHLGLIYVGYASQFTLSLGNSATTQLGGPTDLVVTLNQHGVNTVSILVDGSYKKAVPFVRDAGVWKPAAAYVMTGSVWEATT